MAQNKTRVFKKWAKEQNIKDVEIDRETIFTDSGEYDILTDEEANERVSEYISESVWSFNISFLENFLPESCRDEAETILKPLQEKCEGGNEAIKGLINWSECKEEFIEEAIRWDGRGHFLNFYDGSEWEVFDEKTKEWFYIYRTN